MAGEEAELGGRLVESRVRHLSSVYPNEKLLARVVVAAVSEDGATVDVELRLERAGEVVTSGTGRIALDGTGDS